MQMSIPGSLSRVALLAALRDVISCSTCDEQEDQTPGTCSPICRARKFRLEGLGEAFEMRTLLGAEVSCLSEPLRLLVVDLGVEEEANDAMRLVAIAGAVDRPLLKGVADRTLQLLQSRVCLPN